ncbi:hypothetical protein [Oceanobacillus sp. FSL H7-0719]|uniref:hypothetical protein n=1 Tax=Oceanobacillus sp. FSL H7-0719 TaxID=2954507 RepID=UPI0032564111
MAVKINKKHGGKEFKSSFHFVGKVKPFRRYENGMQVPQPFFDETPTRTGKPQRRVQFVLETAKNNELKIEGRAYVQKLAYAYNREEGETVSVNWDDRFDKDKLPNEGYHFIDTDWDRLEKISELLEEGAFIEVRGEYEFDSFTNREGQEIKLVKRMISSAFPVEEGQEIKRNRKTVVENYVTDFESEDFEEVNHSSIQLGINTVFQEEGEKDVKINGYVLTYGKERSKPSYPELLVPYVEPPAGKVSLSDAFLQLSKFDFVEVIGKDFNTVTYADVEVTNEDDSSFDPFAQVDGAEKVVETKRAVSGTRKGIEILSIVDGSYVSEMLTEEEVKPLEQAVSVNDTSVDQKDNPFSNVDSNTNVDENPFEDDPFA